MLVLVLLVVAAASAGGIEPRAGEQSDQATMRSPARATLAILGLMLIGLAAHYQQRVATLELLLTEQQQSLQQLAPPAPPTSDESGHSHMPAPPTSGESGHSPVDELLSTLIQTPGMKVALALEDEGNCHNVVIRPRVDFKGGDLPEGLLQPESSTACGDACWERPECTRWVYYQEGGNGYCWLKDSSAKMVAGGEALIAGELDKSFVRAHADPLDCWYSKISGRLPTFLDNATQLHGTVIDVGANVGAFSAAIRRKCADCEIVMFEAVPDYASYCERHKDDHMTVVQTGLSDDSAQASLWVSQDPSNRGWNTMIEAEVDKVHMEERVMSFVTFDSWLEGHASNAASLRDFEASISLIKIDTEGAEHRVLKGMRSYLARVQPKPTLLIEVAWGPGKHPEWQKEMEAFEWLFAHGYRRNEVAKITGTTDVMFEPI